MLASKASARIKIRCVVPFVFIQTDLILLPASPWRCAVHVEWLQTALAVFSSRVKLALHDVKLLVHRRGRAMINVKPWIQRLERKHRGVSRRGEGRRRAATRSADRVQVNVVRHLAVGIIMQMKFYEVAFADADETAGNIAAKRPEHILDAIGEPLGKLLDFEVDDDARRVFARNRRRHIRRFRQHGVFHADGFRIIGSSIEHRGRLASRRACDNGKRQQHHYRNTHAETEPGWRFGRVHKAILNVDHAKTVTGLI